LAPPVQPAVLPAPPAALTPLVGRARELSVLRDLLTRDDVRLVTITGPGGVGKTRLALEAGASLPGRVAWVSLAEVRDAGLAAQTLARALGVPDGGDVEQRLAAAPVVLVLDNVEQVGGAAPLVERLLQRCSALRVVLTSRVALRLCGEHEL